MAAITSSAEKTRTNDRTTTYSWVVLGMLVFIYTFNFLDRQLMSILTEPIRKEMGLTDRQLGLLGGIYFAGFYTILGVIVGFFADKTSRVRILAIGSFLWSFFTSMCGLSSSYPMLMASRMGVGVGEAAGAPPSYSIVSDYFPKSKRATAIGLFSLGIPFGIAAGAAFGAKIAAAYGWRTAFKAIGIAGFIATIFLLLVVREPKRGLTDTPEEIAARANLPPVSFISTVKDFFTNPLLVITSIAAASIAFIGYAQLNWTAAFLIRVKGITLQQLGSYYSIELAITMGIGTWGAGQLADFLSKRAKFYYAIVPMVAMALAIPFYLLTLGADGWQQALMYLAVPILLGNAYVAPAVAVIHNHVRPEQRTMAGALFLLLVNFIGLGFGPTYVGELSTHFTEQTGSNVTGLHTALYYVTPFYGVAMLLLAVEAYLLVGQSKKDAALLASKAPVALEPSSAEAEAEAEEKAAATD